MNNENKYSFLSLIKKYSIEIPIIQRDYAQGRKSEEDIAQSFVDSLYDSLTQNKELSLDFIYGKIEKSLLIPIDGQQRLTTLFLLHWYLATKENQLDVEIDNDIKVRDVLKKFSYETRLTSKDFCKKLVCEKLGEENKKIDFSNTEKISELIKKKNWYFLIWDNDPTVVSMLNMIDIIHSKFKNTDESLFNKLTDINKCPIIFYFLPFKEFGLTDEVYIKMNARGKPLTLFEKFKAKFTEFIDAQIKSKLDNEWLDIFWKIENNNNKFDIDNVDNIYFNFFENIVLLLYVEENDVDKKFIDEYSIFKLMKEKPEFFKDKKIISQIVNTFDALTKYNDKDNIFKNFLKPHKSIDYWERVRFYSLLRFFVKSGKLPEQNEIIYKRWIRVTFNLINNTLIQSPVDFYRAVRSIKELSKKMENLYEKYEIEDISFFNKDQVKEEKEKIELIKNNDEWYNFIYDIETHPYFNGQIYFILKMAKENNDYNKEKFKDYSDKLKKIFTDLKESGDYLFERALLTEGDYLVKQGYNWSFCNYNEGLRDKLENWRKVFNDDEKRGYLKELLDKITINNIEEDLNKIIADYSDFNWRYFFIKDPTLIQYCREKQIRYFENHTPPKIYLISKRRLSSAHSELYTYALFHMLGQNNSINYIESISYDEPYLEIQKDNTRLKITTAEVENDSSGNKKVVKYRIEISGDDNDDKIKSILKMTDKEKFININDIDNLKSMIEQIIQL